MSTTTSLADSSSSSGSSSSSSGSGSSSSSSGEGTKSSVDVLARVKKRQRRNRKRVVEARRVEQSVSASESDSVFQRRYMPDKGRDVFTANTGTDGETDGEEGEGAGEHADPDDDGTGEPPVLTEDNLERVDPRRFLHQPLWTNRPHECVSIFWNKGGPVEDPNILPPSTLTARFRQIQKERVLNVAMRMKESTRGWREWTWKQYWAESKKAARSLLKLGVKRGMRVGIFSRNRALWCVAFMGALMIGGVPVGIFDSADSGTFAYIVRRTKMSVIFAGDSDNMARVLSFIKRQKSMKLFAVVSFEPQSEEEVAMLRKNGVYGFSWKEFSLLSGTADSQLQRLVRHRQRYIKAGHCATITFTPGGSGRPKGVMLSHDNLVWTSSLMCGMVGARSSDLAVSYIPLCSVYGLLFDLVGPALTGYMVSFVHKSALRGSLGDILREVQPTFFVGLPYIFQKIRFKVDAWELTHDTHSLRDSLLAWSQRKGVTGTYARQEGKSTPWGWSLAKVFTFRPFLTRIGLARARIVLSVGGPISLDLIEFFQSMGLQIYETYGCYETTGVTTISLPGGCVTGAAGRRLLGTGASTLSEEDRTLLFDETGLPREQDAGEGALWVRGRNVMMGYYKESKRNMAAVYDADGWFNTGDLVRIEDGYLHVDGKIHNVIEVEGQRLIPSRVQARILHHVPGIEFVFVHARESMVALFSPKVNLNRNSGQPTHRLAMGLLKSIYETEHGGAVDEEGAAIDDMSSFMDEVDQHGNHLESVVTLQEALQSKAIKRFLQTRVDAYNEHPETPPAERITAWALAPRSFTVYNGELDFLHKMRRDVIEMRHADLLETLHRH